MKFSLMSDFAEEIESIIEVIMIYQPLSLFDSCKRKVINKYKSDICVLENVLPTSVYQEIVSDFLKCDEILELTDDEQNEFYDIIQDTDLFKPDHLTEGSLKLRLSIQLFHPYYYNFYHEFDFIDEICHINYSYYHIKKIGEGEKDICERCFLINYNPNLLYSWNIWDSNNMIIVKIIRHEKVNGENVYSEIIHDFKNNWCDKCKIEPLFIINNTDNCNSAFHNNGNYYIDENDERVYYSSDDTDMEMECEIVVGNRNDELYNMIQN